MSSTDLSSFAQGMCLSVTVRTRSAASLQLLCQGYALIGSLAASS